MLGMTSRPEAKLLRSIAKALVDYADSLDGRWAEQGQPKAQQATQDELLPIKQVAAVLKLHPATVRAMARRGDFPPPDDIGARKIVFSRRALDQWYRTRDGVTGAARFPID